MLPLHANSVLPVIHLVLQPACVTRVCLELLILTGIQPHRVMPVAQDSSHCFQHKHYASNVLLELKTTTMTVRPTALIVHLAKQTLTMMQAPFAVPVTWDGTHQQGRANAHSVE